MTNKVSKKDVNGNNDELDTSQQESVINLFDAFWVDRELSTTTATNSPSLETTLTGVVSDLSAFATFDRTQMYSLEKQVIDALEKSILAPHINLFKDFDEFATCDDFRVNLTTKCEGSSDQQVFVTNTRSLNLTSIKNGSSVELVGFPSQTDANHFTANSVCINSTPSEQESSCTLVNYLYHRPNHDDLMFALVSKHAAKNSTHTISRSPKFTNSADHENDVLVGLTFAKSFNEAMINLDNNSTISNFVIDCLLDGKSHTTGCECNDLENLVLFVVNKDSKTCWGGITQHVRIQLDRI